MEVVFAVLLNFMYKNSFFNNFKTNLKVVTYRAIKAKGNKHTEKNNGKYW